jgi:hypothetical protein
MVSLAVSVYAAVSAPYFLLVVADRADFRPQALASLPLPRLLLDTDAGARLTVTVFNAKADAREMAADARLFARLSLREAALTVAALYAFLTITPGDAR